jgi:hypothetical protein
MLDFDGPEQAPPFRVTPGFLAFAGLLVLPALAAVGIYLGAALVADEVHAAEAAQAKDATMVNNIDSSNVAGWKRTLVGVCPVH